MLFRRSPGPSVPERPETGVKAEDMKVFITGAAGFIGTYVIQELMRRGDEVVAFDIAPMPGNFSAYSEGFAYVRGDLTDKLDLYRAITVHRPTHILHLASILAGPCEENPGKGFDINFNSTVSLMDAAWTLKVERFVMTSSISVFGPGLDEPVKDDDVKIPATVYGQTKLACEHLMNWYERKGRLSTGGVRFPWVFGPGRSTGITALWSSKLLDKVARDEELLIENPDEMGNWLYVKDAVKALILLLEARNTPRGIYNIMGSAHSIREVMEIAKKIKPEARIQYKDGAKSVSPYPSLYDDSNARKEIAWKPDYRIEDSVAEHIKTVSNQS